VDVRTVKELDPALVDFAAEVGESDPVAVEGTRSQWDIGGSLRAGTRLVRAPAGMLEYQPEEMTVRVRAGTPVSELHAALAERGQRSALPEGPGSGTVGGALAVGRNDLRVRRRGQVRNAVLQIRYASADGRIITGGGTTVKNVSGFDIPRLLVGSLGTLGLIAEVVLRTNPIPSHATWLVSSDVDPFATANIAPRAAVILWDGAQTWIELEGHEADVDDERRALNTVGTWEHVEGPPPLGAHRWSLRPSELARIATRDLGDAVASIGVGTVFANVAQGQLPVPAALARLTQRVKTEFDPSGRLNPGRAVWGADGGAP
jgi:glycolate oxidase FAD binding subunit